jgi:DNA polymerase III alpha subunit (gram-positive type)
MQTEYDLYHTHCMTTRLGAQIEAIGHYGTRSARRRLDELIGQELLSDILTFRVRESESFNNPQYVLVFDTETTGLLPKNMPNNIWTLTNDELREYPYITQLSAVLYDVANQQVSNVFNTYIRIPDNVVIPEIVTQITGITREKCEGGMHIRDALKQFQIMFDKCSNIVAHNMWFDSKMLKLEYLRNNMYCNLFKDYEKMNCTMIEGMRYIGANRFVKLSYLYESLFPDSSLENVKLHDSLADTIVCLRCYLKVFCKQEISDKQFAKMLREI